MNDLTTQLAIATEFYDKRESLTTPEDLNGLYSARDDLVRRIKQEELTRDQIVGFIRGNADSPEAGLVSSALLMSVQDENRKLPPPEIYALDYDSATRALEFGFFGYSASELNRITQQNHAMFTNVEHSSGNTNGFRHSILGTLTDSQGYCALELLSADAIKNCKGNVAGMAKGKVRLVDGCRDYVLSFSLGNIDTIRNCRGYVAVRARGKVRLVEDCKPTVAEFANVQERRGEYGGKRK
jgi:hypothetical protein